MYEILYVCGICKTVCNLPEPVKNIVFEGRSDFKRRKNRQLVPNFVRTQISKFSFMLAQELGKFACYPKMGETILFKNVVEACAREECILSLLF